VTFNFCETPGTNGPGRPTSLRVSSPRAGVVAKNVEEALVAALATNNPPPPSVTATAAPIAAQRERHALDRLLVAAILMKSPLVDQRETDARCEAADPNRDPRRGCETDGKQPTADRGQRRAPMNMPLSAS
jgi:hypothetical protein